MSTTLDDKLAADHDIARLRAHNGFAANPRFVAELTDETSAVKCARHRNRAATYNLPGQPPLCSECALAVYLAAREEPR